MQSRVSLYVTLNFGNQNKAARLIYMKPKCTHTSPLLSDLHWLRITQCIQFKTLVLTYKALHNEFQQYLSDLLHIRSHCYNIRASLRTTLHIPRTNKSAGDRSFAATAPRLGQKKNCYIGVTRSTLKLGPTLHFFLNPKKKKKDKKMTDRS